MLDAQFPVGDRGEDRDHQVGDRGQPVRGTPTRRMDDRVGRVEFAKPVEPPPVPDRVEQALRPTLDGATLARRRRCARHWGGYRIWFEHGPQRNPARRLVEIETDLADHRPVIADQPFGVDLVPGADAISGEAERIALPGGGAVIAGSGVSGEAKAEVCGVEACALIAAPRDVEMMGVAIGRRGDARDRRAYHRLGSAGHAITRIDRASRVVSVADIAHRAILPDLVGDPDDVIDDVGKAVFEARHGLRPPGGGGRDRLADATHRRPLGEFEGQVGDLGHGSGLIGRRREHRRCGPRRGALPALARLGQDRPQHCSGDIDDGCQAHRSGDTERPGGVGSQ